MSNPVAEAAARHPKKAKTPEAPSRYGLRLAAAAAFIAAVAVYALLGGMGGEGISGGELSLLAVCAAVGAYMAMNIGANDVANNMGPAVGSGAITLGGAIVVAAIFEALGAIVAGGAVVGTIKGAIIDPTQIAGSRDFVWIMLSALLAGALWLNLATWLGAPVSTTHSIIGAVMGAGVAGGGWGLVNWGTIGAIAASWVLSPALGGILAALILYLIKRTITYQPDMARAATRVVPLLLAVMTWAFVTYMLMKGLGDLMKLELVEAGLWGLGAAVVCYFLLLGPVRRKLGRGLGNKDMVNELFTWPLVASAALLSFAHGANDVANAVGPLAAIYEAVAHGVVAARAATPLWVMILGASGLAVGLALFGARLIRLVGKEITDLDHMRAYAIAMAAALTVILASQLGMPISTTHVSIGAVIGVGFLRELLKANYAKMEAAVRAGHHGRDLEEVEAYMKKFEAAPVREKQLMVAEMKRRAKESGNGDPFDKKERKAFKKVAKKELVKRSVITRIIAAWLITVPATALLAALLFVALSRLAG